VLDIKIGEGLELEVSGESPVKAFLREFIFVTVRDSHGHIVIFVKADNLSPEHKFFEITCLTGVE
jgi:hypothetical protein